jgi:hypothetical protein
MRGVRAVRILIAMAMVLSLLTACGGGDDDDDGGGGDGDIPVPSGAERLAENEVSADDIDASDVEISDAKAAAYKVSDSSFDDVADYYESEVEDDGWTVEEHLAFGELMLAILVQDNDMVLATAMSGATAKEQEGLTDLGELEVDLDEVADDDILIIAASFTCEEESVDDCIAAMELGV